MPRYVNLIFLIILSSAQITQKQANSGDILKIGYIYRTDFSLNPLIYVSDYDYDFNRLVFGDGLFRKTVSGNIENNLTVSSRKINNNWLIKVRKGAVFHDGNTITAEDVKFSFEVYKKFALQSPNLYIARIIKKVEVVAPDEVSLDLYDSDYDLNETLGLLPILSEKYYSDFLSQPDINASLPDKPVGSGYFKFDRRIGPKGIRLRVHENHFGKRANLNAVDLLLYGTVDNLVEAFIRGEVDFIRVHDRSVLQRIHQIIQMNANKILIKPEFTSLYYIALNSESDLFSQQKIRQALNHAINREQLIEKILGKNGRIADNVLEKSSDFYFNSIKTYPYNPLKSLEILESAGYQIRAGDKLENDKGDLKFELLIEEGSYFYEMMARRISIDMGELGISVIPVPVKASELEERIRSGRYQAALRHFFYDSEVPDQVLRAFYLSALRGSDSAVNFQNRQIEQLLKSAENSYHNNQIQPIMYRIQYLLGESSPCIYLFFEDRIFCAIDSRFENFQEIFIENGKHARILFPEYDWYVPKEKQKYR